MAIYIFVSYSLLDLIEPYKQSQRNTLKKAGLFYIVSVVFMAGCSSTAHHAPSHADNRQLNAISPTTHDNSREKGYLQQKYNAWEEEEWEPATRPEIQEKEAEDAVDSVKVSDSGNDNDNASLKEPKDPNASETFTLQRYIDKWRQYLDAEENTSTGPSNVEKLDAMPVIGETK